MFSHRWPGSRPGTSAGRRGGAVAAALLMATVLAAPAQANHDPDYPLFGDFYGSVSYERHIVVSDENGRLTEDASITIALAGPDHSPSVSGTAAKTQTVVNPVDPNCAFSSMVSTGIAVDLEDTNGEAR